MPRAGLDKEEFGFFVNQASMLDDKTWESVIRTRQRIRELKRRIKKPAPKKPRKPEDQANG